MSFPENAHDAPPQRHGCVTAWLVLIIAANSLAALVYFFATDLVTRNLPHEVSTTMIMLLGGLGIANVVFAFLLLRWKKIGFWGFAISAVATLAINLSIGLGIGQSLFGLVGVVVLFGILQIKQGNASTWQNLE